jgi:cell division protein FtsQ
MGKEKIVSIEDRIPKLKEQRRKKANRRLVFYLSIFFILISIIVYLQSPLSQIKHFEVNGNTVLSDEEIIEKSGIASDTNIWVIQKSQVKQNIKEHPVIQSVEVSRKFPQTIQLDVNEHHIIGYMEEDAIYHPILQNGTIITNETITNKGDGPLLHNFKKDAYLERMAAELNGIPEDIFNLISEITWEPTKKNKYKIIMYMNDGFIVDATIRNLATKMKAYPSIIAQLDEGEKGIIHMGVGTYFEKTNE